MPPRRPRAAPETVPARATARPSAPSSRTCPTRLRTLQGEQPLDLSRGRRPGGGRDRRRRGPASRPAACSPTRSAPCSSCSEAMERRVVGQAHALEAVAQAIRTSRAGLTDPRKPIGVFLMVGTSGVGKTETALTLARPALWRRAEHDRHQHDRVQGGAQGLPADGLPARLCRLWRRRRADRGGPAPALSRRPARRDGEGPSRRAGRLLSRSSTRAT